MRAADSHHRPGQTVKLVDKVSCDYCEKPAVLGLVIESDIFGVEIAELCATCYASKIKEIQNELPKVQMCDLCHQETSDCKPWSDPEEGFSGRIQAVCEACRAREKTRLEYLFGDESEVNDADFDDDVDQEHP